MYNRRVITNKEIMVRAIKDSGFDIAQHNNMVCCEVNKDELLLMAIIIRKELFKYRFEGDLDIDLFSNVDVSSIQPEFQNGNVTLPEIYRVTFLSLSWDDTVEWIVD